MKRDHGFGHKLKIRWSSFCSALKLNPKNKSLFICIDYFECECQHFIHYDSFLDRKKIEQYCRNIKQISNFSESL